ncbi:16S rRNA pseudouridine(516) synthase [Mycoplasma crocodyli]|uniref:Pseudouridine synthase n=1 Tax=Mycoplasma crocodyli (strain ATCC 51981 / MP145) TaxID=512564 RepID=D5E631_MYCCM|nr:16S rRNA pseudouridine(516) synthase [Mycoplasma crocodyli]ADE19703.1 ribosomal small subunit pseudouridine synthase A [Mycoplasma crocodyli MP145]
MRIEKWLSDVTDYTRSEIKNLLKNNRVYINGRLYDETIKYNEFNSLRIDGIDYATDKYVYIMLNKPQGYITSNKDELYPSVFNLIDVPRKNLIAYGRLDVDTEGLLVLSDNHKLCHELLAPKKHVFKKYLVQVDKQLEPNLIDIFKQGFSIGEDKNTLPSKLEIIDNFTCYLTISEGKFHQVKRMFKTNGYNVIFLKRVSFKNIILDEKLKPSQWRFLSSDEINDLIN